MKQLFQKKGVSISDITLKKIFAHKLKFICRLLKFSLFCSDEKYLYILLLENRKRKSWKRNLILGF